MKCQFPGQEAVLAKTQGAHIKGCSKTGLKTVCLYLDDKQ